VCFVLDNQESEDKNSLILLLLGKSSNIYDIQVDLLPSGVIYLDLISEKGFKLWLKWILTFHIYGTIAASEDIP